MSFTVYAIIDPRSQRPFYVGETKAFQRRCRQHLEGTDQISGLVIRQIQENGFVPHFVVLEVHDNEETALRAEIFWIELMLGRGIDLVNSQAFNGYHDRQSKRRAETAKLSRMQRLRALANGRTAERTANTRLPKTTKAHDAQAHRHPKRSTRPRPSRHAANPAATPAPAQRARSPSDPT